MHGHSWGYNVGGPSEEYCFGGSSYGTGNGITSEDESELLFPSQVRVTSFVLCDFVSSDKPHLF